MLDDEKRAALSDKKKRMWVHKCFRSIKSEGEYWTLYKELADEEIKFYQYFRMSKHQFNYLLQKIEKDLKKKNTAFREAIFFFKGFIAPKLKKVHVGLQNCSYTQFTTVSLQVLISK